MNYTIIHEEEELHGKVIYGDDGVIYWKSDSGALEVLQDADSLCGSGLFETGFHDFFRPSCGWHDHAYTNRAWFEAAGWDRAKIDYHFYELMLVQAEGNSLRILQATAYYRTVKRIGWLFYYRHPGANTALTKEFNERDYLPDFVLGDARLIELRLKIMRESEPELLLIPNTPADRMLLYSTFTADHEYPRKFGWKRDTAQIEDEERTFKFTSDSLPKTIDLRDMCGAVLDQKSLGSCTAHALAAGHMFAQRKQGITHMVLPSRLFIYYYERLKEGSVESDSGAMIRTGIEVLSTIGVCKEEFWTYTDSITEPHNFRTPPSKRANDNAGNWIANDYKKIRDLHSLKACLAHGFPVVFGFSVYSSFMSAQVATSGYAPFPQRHEQALGGHAVLAVGYIDNDQGDSGYVICQNSWGRNWGDAGFFYLPYEYFTRGLADDAWAITRLVEKTIANDGSVSV